MLQESTAAVQYRTIYDAARTGYQTWWFGLAGLVFVAFGSAMWWRPAWFGPPVALRRRLGVFAAAFGLLWASCASAATYGDYRRVVDALRSGRYDTVEGAVSAFRPRGADGHPPETWRVVGHIYKIEPAVISSGFREPGQIRPGQRVRIADVDGEIARLEVAE